MESLEHLRRSLESLDDLRTIVRTMKALSAASIRQYEQATVAVEDYHRTVRRGLQVGLRDGPPPPVARSSGGAGPIAAIVFGSDLGLCGRFNEEIAEYATHRMRTLPVDPKARLLLAVGTRVAAALEYENQASSETLLVPSSAPQITGTVQQILLKIDSWTKNADVQEVHLFYNRHVRRQGYQPRAYKLLPIDPADLRAQRGEPWPSRGLPIFTMKREVLLSRLLRQYLFVVIFRACAESLASEHASRLAAMQSAESSLEERLGELTMLFRRARQSAITADLLDVVSGFEATTGGET